MKQPGLQYLSKIFAGARGLMAALVILLLVTACTDSGDRGPPAMEAEAPLEPESEPEPVDAQYPDHRLITLPPGDDLEQRALEALISAEPMTVIQLPAGVYDFSGELSVSVDNIVLKGMGMDASMGTVLRFDSQTSGSQSILATGDRFTIEHLAVENSPGDAIKIKGSNGVTIRGVRVEWTNGPDTDNGAYGLYPVQTRNVLIEDCEVRGASDAGVYVGQSQNIIVRRNFVYENVAGIEIENSKYADVYDNETTANTGGILVFDLPGPPVQGGEATRVFNNRIYDNNTANFAPEGNIVGTVPAGTGIMIMANDDIEVFGNRISGNQSGAVIIVSYYINDVGISKPDYDPVPEKIFVHDNTLSNNSTDPQALAGTIADVVFGGRMVDIFYDSSGVATDAGLILEYPQGLSEDRRICAVNNGPDITLGQVNASVLLAGLPFPADIDTDPERFRCSHASLPEIVLEDVAAGGDTGATVDVAALCGAGGEGINAAAYAADCPNLSDYRLFADAGDPTSGANGGVIYDLTSPLFTDYAYKYRFLFVPEGASAAYRSQEVFDFPVGTIISKTFAIASDLRDSSSQEQLLETRLLIHRQDGWAALPYIWNDERTNAVLSVTGGTREIRFTDLQGESRSTDYVIPNSNNCGNCHGESELLPIGPKARLLNREYPYVRGLANQLSHFSELGILTGAPADLAAIETIPEFGNLSADLDRRARGYLDINCAHCHSENGAADTSGLLLDYNEPFGLAFGECKPPVAAGDGAGDLSYDIVPGDAASSILAFRMNSNEPDVRMPEIGRSIIHSEGVQLIADWINAMPSRSCSP